MADLGSWTGRPGGGECLDQATLDDRQEHSPVGLGQLLGEVPQCRHGVVGEVVELQELAGQGAERQAEQRSRSGRCDGQLDTSLADAVMNFGRAGVQTRKTRPTNVMRIRLAGPTDVERIIQRFPGVSAAPVYAVADPRTGDRVMCAVEMLPGAEFDPAAFGAFLAHEPEMGGKWWPSFVRVTGEIPLTGSGKVNKAPLRRTAWNTEDPVYARIGKTDEYEALDGTARARIEAEFIEHGRTALLPAPL